MAPDPGAVAPDLFLFLLTLPAVGLLGGGLLGVLLARVPWRLVLCAAAIPLALFFHSVFSGPKASRVPGRILWEAALVAGTLIALHAARRLPALTGRPRARRSVGLAALLLAALLHRADATLYVGTYGQIHAALALAAAGLAALGAGLAGLAPPLPSLRLLLVVAAALVVRGGWSLGGSDRLRWTLRRHAPAAGKLARVADRAFRRVPPAGSPELLTVILPGPDPGRAARAAALDGLFPGRHEADVLLITIDALRPDRLGTYGALRGATPQLDRLARESVHFPETRAQYPGTRFSLSSLFRSLYPACTPEHCLSLGRAVPEKSAPLLAERLRAAGWITAAFFCQEPRDLADPGLYAFFQEGVSHVGNVFQGSFHFTTGPIVEAARVWLRARPEGRSFLWVYLDEPHHPYTGQPEHPFGPGEEDRYLSEIATVDEGVGSILETIRSTRRLGRTVVVVHSDHGEEFGEHGGRQHLTTAYEEQVRVPLFFRVPGLRGGAAAAQAALVDVVPTLMELLGLAPDPALQGRSLVPQLLDPSVPLDRPVFSQVDPYSVTANRLRAVTSGGWKLIHDLDADVQELYDLRADPAERRNLAGTGRAREPELEALLRTFESLPCLASREPAPPPLPRPAPAPPAPAARLLADLEWPDPVRQVPAALALAEEEASPEALKALRRAARHPLPQLRSAATYALAAHGEPGDEQALLPFLTCEEERLRFVACLGLALLGRAEFRFALQEALERHDASFAKVALRRIGAAPAPEDLPALRTAAQDGGLPLPLRAEAIRAIARVDHPDAARALARFERDPARPLAAAARAALETRPATLAAAARIATDHEDEAAEVEWQGSFARAQALYRQGLEADPGNGDVRMGLARLLWNLGREEEASGELGRFAPDGVLPHPRAGALMTESLRRAGNGGSESTSLSLLPPAFERAQRSGERVVLLAPIRNLSAAPQLGFSWRTGLTLRWTGRAPDGARSEGEVEVPFPVPVIAPHRGVVIVGAIRPPAGPGLYELAFEVRAGPDVAARCEGGVLVVVATSDRSPREALGCQLGFEVEGTVPPLDPGSAVEVPVRLRYRGPIRLRGGEGPGSLTLWPVFAEGGEAAGEPLRFPAGVLEPGAEATAVLRLRATDRPGTRMVAFLPELGGVGFFPAVDWSRVRVGP